MDDLDFPICILKMNLQCCQDLPSRVKRRLRKVKGVYFITLDLEKGLILVAGTAEPHALIKAVERTGQSPQLYAYEKDPAKAKIQFRALLKRYAAKERRDEPQPKADEGTCPVSVRGFGHSGPPPNAGPGTCPAPFSGFGYPGLPSMPVFTLPRTTDVPGFLQPGRPRLVVRYEQPETLPTKPPAPYPFSYYSGGAFPASDSLFRYFSDDHAQPCTIM